MFHHVLSMPALLPSSTCSFLCYNRATSCSAVFRPGRVATCQHPAQKQRSHLAGNGVHVRLVTVATGRLRGSAGVWETRSSTHLISARDAGTWEHRIDGRMDYWRWLYLCSTCNLYIIYFRDALVIYTFLVQQSTVLLAQSTHVARYLT